MGNLVYITKRILSDADIWIPLDIRIYTEQLTSLNQRVLIAVVFKLNDL